MNNGRIVIENVQPVIDCGRYPVKRVIGERVTVSADIFSHGVERIGAEVQFRKAGEQKWNLSQMIASDNDRWFANFEPQELGLYEFKIDAWIDKIEQWKNDVIKWIDAGEDVSTDIDEGIRLINTVCIAESSTEAGKLSEIIDSIRSSTPEKLVRILRDVKIDSFLKRVMKKQHYTETKGIFSVQVDPRISAYSSWYEMFPRSQSNSPARSGTFTDCKYRLADVSEMGFNVLYLTPIHPVGITNRRGKNGAREASPGDPGSPWAIGNESGGHKSINSELGSMKDFEDLVKSARSMGIEIAMDIAFQCSPDHPYVSKHPDWFYRRPDGSIRYAENPPKRYFDIYPLNFDTSDWKNLWKELKSIFTFWIDKGVKIFRVDNPHTKPIEFWKWLISGVREKHPDVLFFAEAFTRPKVMYELSKIGFTQSYSYFTWKNYHYELIEYFTELNSPPVSEHFRPVLFTNTPDILTDNLRLNGKPTFMIRAFLAATLSPSWGIYSGFELIENEGKEGSEEYLNSEKYEIRVRNWKGKGNIRKYIGKLNQIRSRLMPLQEYRNLRFLSSDNPNILVYERGNPESNVIIAVNINPNEAQIASIDVSNTLLGNTKGKHKDLLEYVSGTRIPKGEKKLTVRLVPSVNPGIVIAGGKNDRR